MVPSEKLHTPFSLTVPFRLILPLPVEYMIPLLAQTDCTAILFPASVNDAALSIVRELTSIAVSSVGYPAAPTLGILTTALPSEGGTVPPQLAGSLHK